MKKIVVAILSVLLLSSLSFTMVGCNNSEEKYPKASSGLEFTLSEDQSYYILTNAAGCTDEYVVIPEKHENKPVKEIGDSTFYSRKDIKGVIIPKTVKKIGAEAFRNCEVESIEFWKGSELEEIGRNAFINSSIKSINIPKKVKKISYCAFSYCSELTTLTFEKGSELTVMDTECFYQCKKLTSFVLPEGLLRIEDEAFRGCESISELTIPKNVSYIGSYCFYSCEELTRVNFLGNDKITDINNNTFAHCDKLISVNIPESVINIENEAFQSCGFTEINIPKNVEKVAGFSYCDELVVVNFLGSNLKTLTRNAFAYCSKFSTINFNGTREQWDSVDKQGVDMWHYNSLQLTINVVE